MIRTFTAKFSAWRRFRESVRELSRLSDRELNDLGIGRFDIRAVAAFARRAPTTPTESPVLRSPASPPRRDRLTPPAPPAGVFF